MKEEVRAARYRDLFAVSHQEASDCAYCPLCTAIGAVRRTRPELVNHLAAAAKEVLLAAGILLEEAGQAIASVSQPEEPAASEPKVRRIDIA